MVASCKSNGFVLLSPALPKRPAAHPHLRSMADGALSCVTSHLLAMMASEAFKGAFGRSLSLWGVKNELYKLKTSMETMASMLHNAEVTQRVPAADVMGGLGTLRDLLYEAEDLFDEVATNHLLNPKQMKGKIHLKEVQFTISKLFLISVTRKVKAIRKSLDAISKDMSHFNSNKQSPYENLMARLRVRDKTTSNVEKTKVIVGRDNEKKAILEFLFSKSGVERNVSVIGIVGIAGIGKTTLAQLIYNSEEVQINFENKWWANTSEEKEVLEIVKSIHTSIGNYLLVLDDLCDNNASLWNNYMPELMRGTVGSRIIVTARSLAKLEMNPDRTFPLDGLTKEESWQLFKKIVVQPELENDPLRISLGREIVERCHNVPLAIESIATHLSNHTPLPEWKSLKNRKELFDASVISTLRLSYDPLESHLKNCFAYCSLFPEDYAFDKEGLICLWISQGYLKPTLDYETLKTTCFEELLNRSLFHEEKVDEYGEIFSCSVHGFIHHLAENVAGDGSTILIKGSSELADNILHLSVGYSIDSSWNIPPALLNAKRLRSFLFLYEGSLSPLALDKLLAKFKWLRALNLGHQNIGVVPSSIGELKYLRYLNLSYNKFTNLPDSIIMLVNLLTLDISWCQQLVSLPDKFRELTNLRHLDTKGCYRLRHMPPGFEELTCLQWLSFFKVGNKVDASNRSKLDALARSELKGELELMFDENIDAEEERWELPGNISVLTINNYQGVRLPNMDTLDNLVRLFVGPSSKIKQLSQFRGLPCLETLHLSNLYELEYIDTNESMPSPEATTSDTAFFRSLKDLILERLPKLKGWSSEVEAAFASKRSIPSLNGLSKLTIQCCQELKFMPLCPSLKTLKLNDANDELIQWFFPSSFQYYSSPSTTPSPNLVTVTIRGCDSITSFSGETLTSLENLELRFCDNMEKLCLAPPKSNALKQLVIESCLDLELWKEGERGVIWDSFTNLCKLVVLGMPKPEKLPDCLQHRNLLLTMDRQKNKVQAKQMNLTTGGNIKRGIEVDGPKTKY